MPKYGFNSSAVTMSTPATSAIEGINYQTGCTTDYPEYSTSNKDSAILIDASQLLAVETGYWFGVPENSTFGVNNDHQCGAIVEGYAHAPVPTQPVTVTDVHNYPCSRVDGQDCDPNLSTYSAAYTIYSKIGQFLTNNAAYGLLSNPLLIGETDASSTLTSHPTFTVTDAKDDGQGFHDSGLASGAPTVVLRPWEMLNFSFPLDKPAALSGDSSLPFNVGLCTYYPPQSPVIILAEATAGTFYAGASAGCEWSVAPAPTPFPATTQVPPTAPSPSYPPWFTPATATWQSGNGGLQPFNVNLQTNTSCSLRSFQMTIAGANVTITQNDVPAPTPLSPGRWYDGSLVDAHASVDIVVRCDRVRSILWNEPVPLLFRQPWCLHKLFSGTVATRNYLLLATPSRKLPRAFRRELQILIYYDTGSAAAHKFDPRRRRDQCTGESDADLD
jgi:hypothetical protein